MLWDGIKQLPKKNTIEQKINFPNKIAAFKNLVSFNTLIKARKNIGQNGSLSVYLK